MAEQFKRNIAYKYRIGDLLMGKPVMDGEKFSFLELGGKRIVRVNVVGNIVEKYESEGEKKYMFMTLDDGSGQLRLKIFGDDVPKFAYLNQGDTVVVIGVLRNFNNETYVSPEIVKTQDPKYLLVRKLELEKERAKSYDPVAMGKEQIVAVKDKILNAIKSAEGDGGMEMDKMMMQLRDVSPDIINQEVQKLLEEGIVFEPYPGKVRYLG